MVDSSQAVENSYCYEAFGQPTVGQSDVANPYLFVGGYGVQWESTPSLYFMQARYYGPGVGRFISEDPVWRLPAGPDESAPVPVLRQWAGEQHRSCWAVPAEPALLGPGRS